MLDRRNRPRGSPALACATAVAEIDPRARRYGRVLRPVRGTSRAVRQLRGRGTGGRPRRRQHRRGQAPLSVQGLSKLALSGPISRHYRAPRWSTGSACRSRRAVLRGNSSGARSVCVHISASSVGWRAATDGDPGPVAELGQMRRGLLARWSDQRAQRIAARPLSVARSSGRFTACAALPSRAASTAAMPAASPLAKRDAVIRTDPLVS